MYIVIVRAFNGSTNTLSKDSLTQARAAAVSAMAHADTASVEIKPI